jgi:hypothetical protein
MMRAGSYGDPPFFARKNLSTSQGPVKKGLGAAESLENLLITYKRDAEGAGQQNRRKSGKTGPAFKEGVTN